MNEAVKLIDRATLDDRKLPEDDENEDAQERDHAVALISVPKRKGHPAAFVLPIHTELGGSQLATL